MAGSVVRRGWGALPGATCLLVVSLVIKIAPALGLKKKKKTKEKV